MNAINKACPMDALEEWRDNLNRAIIKSDFNLSDPNVVDLSGRVDILVLNEMREIELHKDMVI